MIWLIMSLFSSFCFSSYGHQRWAITFSRHDKSLGVYLVWKNPSEGMKVFVDFSITLLNRDHYSENISFLAKNIKYTGDAKSMYTNNQKFHYIVFL